jgi:hypothetical protein
VVFWLTTQFGRALMLIGQNRSDLLSTVCPYISGASLQALRVSFESSHDHKSSNFAIALFSVFKFLFCDIRRIGMAPPLRL